MGHRRRRSRRLMVSGSAHRGDHRRSRPQPGRALVIRVPPLGLRAHTHRQVPVLRDAGACSRPDLGVLRHLESRTRGFLFARRLRHGYVPDATDRSKGRVRRSRAARLHGLSELEVAALVLVWLQPPPVRARDDGARARLAGTGVRVVCVSVARDRRLSFDHHPGAYLRSHARVLPQRHGVRRQQRIHRFQGHPGFRSALRQDPCRAAGTYRSRARGQLFVVPRDCRIARRARAPGDSRCGEPDAFSWLLCRILQALGLRVFSRHCRCRRRAVRASDRHHQPERVCADQFDRSRHLGGGRRARHALRRSRRRGAGELRENLSHRRVSRDMAVRARCIVRAGDALSAARHRWPRPGATFRKMSVRGKTLYLEKLTVSFDGFKALNELSLYVDPGELLCIIGPNGAGKTTMMDVVTGKTRPDSGTAWFGRDIDLLKLSEPEIVEAGIGRKFQNPTVFEQLTVFENLELALAGGRSFLKTLRARITGAQQKKIDEVLHITGLAEHSESRGKILSHGQKQWLEIGMLLMQEPELLLVDEPVAGMTPQEIDRTARLLLSLAGEHTVVVVEHDMDFVRSIARRVTVLHEGRVIAEGDMDQVQNDPRVIEVYLGV